MNIPSLMEFDGPQYHELLDLDRSLQLNRGLQYNRDFIMPGMQYEGMVDIARWTIADYRPTPTQVDNVARAHAAERAQEPPREIPIVGLAPTLESRVFAIRKNDTNMNHLYIGSTLDPRAWKQLGQWIRTNQHVYYACLAAAHIKGKPLEDLCAGLQHNTSVREFEISDNPLKKEEMASLAPFIRTSPTLRTLNIENCLGACCVELLSSALMDRSTSLENVALDGNCLGGGDAKEHFDTFITALCKNKKLKRLSLIGNQIGSDACKSLARLLKGPDSQLKSLILRHNCIDDKAAGILAESLSNNTQLNNIDLDRNERVSGRGLMQFLQTLSGTSGATIHIKMCWISPETEDKAEGKMSVSLPIKLNEPLHCLATQLIANRKWEYTGDWKDVKLMIDRRRLDWCETPFYYGMKDGDSIGIVFEKDGIYCPANLPDLTAVKSDVRGCSLNSGFTSNHTLSSLGYETALKRNFIHGQLLREFLEANKREDKVSVARIKIFRCHVEYDLSLADLTEVSTGMQPVLLAWIGRALGERDAERVFGGDLPSTLTRADRTYRLIRAMPWVCSFNARSSGHQTSC